MRRANPGRQAPRPGGAPVGHPWAPDPGGPPMAMVQPAIFPHTRVPGHRCASRPSRRTRHKIYGKAVRCPFSLRKAAI
jgi:hypothetical protein